MSNSFSIADDKLPPLREVIDKYKISANRKLGQNFILDFNLTRRIARLGGDLKNKTVIEVGPGPGGLTRALLMEGAKKVIAIEKDERCIGALKDISAAYPARLEIHHSDALKMDWMPFISDNSSPLMIIANLPYNIATLLLIHFLEFYPEMHWWDRMVLMFQKEVAERIVSSPGSKVYGRLSVISQYVSKPKIVLSLPPTVFSPQPEVSSSVVVFESKQDLTPPCSIKVLGKITAAAFNQRR
ncbi:MAG: 16S rRNA (adenine(1518)-N(6)/adenine(1519)-N(6))-dimethyltransferase RsmA, partial [Hyphomicrobium sp.]